MTKTLTATQRHIDRIKDLMWKQTLNHPLSYPHYFGSINYGYNFRGGDLSKEQYNLRFSIKEVRKTHRFINNLIRGAFGESVPIWWFIEHHSDTTDDDGNTVDGRLHSHFLVGCIDDDVIINPNSKLLPLFYQEDDCGIPIAMRNADVEQLKQLLLNSCIRQAKWVGSHPKALKLDYVPLDEMVNCYYYSMKQFTSNLDQMDEVIDWGNSSYYKP